MNGIMKNGLGFVAVIAVVAFAGAVHAQTAVDIGGKTSLTGLATVTTIAPDNTPKSTAVVLGGLGAYTTEDGRWEFGAGLTIVAAFSKGADLAAYNITGQGRINTNPMGPEENVILYAGLIAGLSIVEVEAGGMKLDDELGIFGPKIGGEIYLSPTFAVQLQEALLFDTDKGITNQLTLGFKFLFN